MKIRASQLGAVCVLLFTLNTNAANTHYVDANGTNPVSPYTDWSTAATNIQDAIDAATDGDLVLVTNGIYATGGRVVYGSLTNRVAINKAVTVLSVNGPAATTIQGNTALQASIVRCVYLTNGASLMGFTLTGGSIPIKADIKSGSGSGAFCESLSAIVSNCIISGNSAPNGYGGGAYGGALINCIFTNNAAINGGGAASNTLANCTLAGNVGSYASTSYGGGAYGCVLSNCMVVGNYFGSANGYGGGAGYSTLTSCIVSNNSCNTSGGGGGVAYCFVNSSLISSNYAPGGGGAYQSSIVDCLVVGNAGGVGGGANQSSVTNCVVVSNTGTIGGGVYGGTLNNSVVYYNNGLNGSNYNSGTFRYCCTLPLPSGAGNITNEPVFVNLAGDYHLSPASPCINAGNNSFVTVSSDLDDNPRIVQGTVDIGSYEFQSPLHFVRLNNSTPVSPFTNWPTAAANIQDAVDAANAGDFIVVSNGVYQTGGRVVYGSLTNRVVLDKAVTVQSVNGPSFTTIQGYQIPPSSTDYTNNVRCVYMTNNSVLSGFTITNGATLAAGTNITQLSGGGVFCESTNNSILTNCMLTRNLCFSQYHSFNCGGGAVYQGILNNCTLSNNMVSTNVMSYQVPGGGALRSVLNNCLIISNFSSFGGGAAFSILNGCSVIGNTVKSSSSIWGGGIYKCLATQCVIAGNAAFGILGNGGGDCLGTLNNCVLSNNFASNGGGSYQQTDGSYTPAINNCLIVSNLAAQGGGIYLAGTLSATNCTIFGNTATNQGGGIYSGILKNSIVYGNFCTSAFYGFSSNIYSTKLTNCWMINPVFENPALGDFRLQSNSPCINAGNNAYVASSIDLDGNPRIVGGTVDIGAYEYQTPSSILSYAWAQQYGLPTDGSADYADTDNDGMNNFTEWKSHTDPTNALSLLQLATPAFTNSPDGIVVTWQSVASVTYYLQRSSDLAGAFSSIQSNLVGQAGSTSYTDTTATNGGPYFYRVGVQ